MTKLLILLLTIFAIVKSQTPKDMVCVVQPKCVLPPPTEIDPSSFMQDLEFPHTDLFNPAAVPQDGELKPYPIPAVKEMASEFNSSALPVFFNKMCFKRGLTFAMNKRDKSTGTSYFSCLGNPNTDLPGSPTTCGYNYGDTYCFRARPIACINKVGIPRPSYTFTGSADSNGWTEAIVQVTPPVAGCAFKYKKDADYYCEKLFGCGYKVADFHDGRYINGMNGVNYSNFSWNPSITMKGFYGFWAFFINMPNVSQRYWVTHNDLWGANPHCWLP